MTYLGTVNAALLMMPFGPIAAEYDGQDLPERRPIAGAPDLGGDGVGDSLSSAN